MRDRRREPLPLFDVENEISLRPHQALRRRGAVEISRDQLLDFGRLQPDLAPQPGDVAIERLVAASICHSAARERTGTLVRCGALAAKCP